MSSTTIVQPIVTVGTGSTQSPRHILFTGSSSRPKSPEVLPPSLRNRYRKVGKQEGPRNEGAMQENPGRKSSLSQLDESSEWAKKNILSLDGGGIRGYSSLLILQHLMKECARTELKENPNFNSSDDSPWALDAKSKGPSRIVITPEAVDIVALKCNPCHYFDFIAGTSTGGLIALMLSRLRYSVDKCIAEYERLGAIGIFGKPLRPKIALQPKRSKSWPDQTYETTLQDIFNPPIETRHGAFEDPTEFASDPERCRTIVLSLQMKNGSGTPYIFRSYNLPNKGIDPLSRNPGEGSNFSVCDVAHATSAAPYHFKPPKRRNSRGASEAVDEVFTDGSFWVNNPSWEVLNEVLTMNDRSEGNIGIFCSLGTGETSSQRQEPFWKSLWSPEKTLLKALGSQSDEIHQQFVRNSGVPEYRRFSVNEGLENIALDEWKPKRDGSKTLNEIRDATREYLQQEKVAIKLRECAKTLVDRRRLRAKTGRWEEFALDIGYKCNRRDCPRGGELLQKRSELMRHLRKEHNMLPPDMNNFEEIQHFLDLSRVPKSEPGDVITKS